MIPFSLLLTIILTLPRKGLPKLTVPSISEISAVALGRRPSNSSDTRGRPPVISDDFWSALGVLAIISAIFTSEPSLTNTDDLGSIAYLKISPSSVASTIVGLYSEDIWSLIIRRLLPVNSSNCSDAVVPTIISS